LPRDAALLQGKCVILFLRFYDPTDSFMSWQILSWTLRIFQKISVISMS